MNDAVVKVEDLSKKYALGMGVGPGDLRESIAEALRSFARRAIGRPYSPIDNRKADEFWALTDVSFEVEQGEVFGIIGRNGAGKSTLLKVLSRVSPPSRGRAVLTGRVGSLLEVGTGFHPELSGRENTYLNGAILGMTKHEIDARYDSIVSYAGIEAFMETPVKRYSSGMRVRLGFAIAAHVRPEILILDEVLAVGDVEFQRKSSRTILEYAESGNTILFVSHNMESVRSICNRVLFLEAGKVRFIGVPDEAIRLYEQSMWTGNKESLLDLPRNIASLTPMIERVRFFDADGKAVIMVDAGAPVSVRVDMRNPHELTDPYIEIVIKDALGTRISLISTRVQQTRMEPLPQCASVSVDIEHLPLLPGAYFFTIAIGNEGKRIDFLNRAAELQVGWADIFGTGSLQDNNRGPVIMRAKCQVIS